MDMNNTRLKELLDKYLQGTATEAEISEVDHWYRSFENDPALTAQFSPEQRMALEQLLFLRISRQVEAAEPPVRVGYRSVRWAAAAAVALLIAAGAFYLVRQQTTKPDTTLATITEQTNKNAIKKISLPDGSLLWLNIDSKVRYAKQGRELWLDGEGYFEVAPQQGTPFLVHAGALNINVLGTSFNIDAYTPDAKVTVTVASGKVAVGNEQHQPATLTANQQAVYLPAENQLETNDITAADVSAWTQGQLIFKNARFRDIAQRLERRYDVRIRFASEPIANSVLTARFDANVPFKNVLGMLCDIYGFSYRQEPGKNEYLVFKKGQPAK
ncbi:FecR family protein [Chitinophaga arvensicola]|uniref:Ferric-dicitrate binding protein FerR, regulates iron transport through sigma-19 n=1 Tax=Chitinophaga arvensicola TaxID=29529 RepID=A0A1I0SAX1_9BACT|nr:FecR domain-containing protein [Chitinophaga arvensicola]SEW53769.1 ferric-dicitrate binding protein FerR, regulates iron transport through sigma-19 [Chitinophaga arvensicola]